MSDEQPPFVAVPIEGQITPCPEFVPIPLDHDHCARCGWDVWTHRD